MFINTKQKNTSILKKVTIIFPNYTKKLFKLCQ